MASKIKECKNCKKVFTTNEPRRKKYCTNKCYREYRLGKIKCFYCRQECTKYDENTKFCDTKCFSLWRKNNNQPKEIVKKETFEKKCYRCKVIKELSNFAADKSKGDGLQSNCKLCKIEMNRNYYSGKKSQGTIVLN